MAGSLFPTGMADSFAGNLDKHWFDARFNEISGMYELETATTLEQQLEAACKVMKSHMLGFWVLSEQCRQNQEF